MSLFNISNNPLIISNEAIEFQFNHKLGIRLEQCFQKVFDFKQEKIKEAEELIKQGRTSSILNYIEKPIINYVRKEMNDEFIKIVKQEIGLDINKIYYSSHLNFMYAMTVDMQEIQEYFENMSASSGVQYKDIENKQISEWIKLADNLDLKTSKLTIKNFPVKAIFYFDPYASFLWEYFINDKVEPLTVKETTSIMLHEIGHVITSIEMFGNLYYVADYYKNQYKKVIQNVKSIDDVKDSIDYIKNSLDEIKNKLNSAESLKIFKTTIEIILQILYILINYIIHLTANISENSLSFASITIVLLLFKLVLTLYFPIKLFIRIIMFGPLTAFPTNTIFNIIGSYFRMMDIFSRMTVEQFSDLYSAADNRKISDFTNTQHNVYNIERRADEYVSRMGYGSYIASGLTKAYAINIISKNKYIRNNRFVNLICYTNSLFTKAIAGNLLKVEIYEEMDRRAKRLVQNNIAGLRKQDLPGPLKDQLIKDSQMVLDILEHKYSKNIFGENIGKFKSLNNFKDFIDEYLSLNKLTFAIVNANLHKDYEKFLNKLEDFVNNPLYLSSSKLQQLAKK